MASEPIYWHEQCLCNAKKHQKELVEEFERFKQNVEKSASQIDKLEKQIARAKAMNKVSFDADKFSPL